VDSGLPVCDVIVAERVVLGLTTGQNVFDTSGVPRFFHGVYTRIFFRVAGFQQIQLRTGGRENGNLGAVATSQGFH
jgi:hypothetical protein